MNDMLDAALSYATQGWAVLALSPNSKIPIKDSLLQPNGSLSATTDPEIITKLFTTYPKANIGIACGENFTVVDLDGPEAKEALTQAGLDIPECRTHKTPRGFHLLLSHQGDDLPQTAGLLPKVDIRNGSSNGYIVAPPSMIDGNPYKLIRDLPLGQWPELVEYAKTHKPSSRPRTGDTAGWDDVTQPSWVSEYLSGGAPEGQRNDITARLAGYLNSKRIPIDVARQLLETFRLACDPPMGERELDQTLQSIYRYIPAENVFTNEDVSMPVVLSEIANRRVFRYSSEDLVVELSRIYTSRNGIDCWIKFSTHTDPLFGPVRLNLLSSSGRESLARLLKNRKPMNWQMVLDQVSNMVSSSLEEGGAAKDMRFYSPESVDKGWCIRPYVQTNQATIMFGFAGNGKSTIATALLLSKATGAQLLPFVDPGFPGAVLYADWEDSEESFNTTASAILHGHQLGWGDVIKPVLYRRYHGSLADHFDALAADIAEHDIKLICVDSLVAASGDQYSPNDAEAARTWHQVVSALGVSSIGITHAAKNSKEPSAFGSVYYTNLARSIFEVSADAEAGRNSSVIAVTHRKGNNTGLMKPVGLSVDFESDEFDNPIKIQYASADLTQSEVLATKLSSSDRIVSLITKVSMSPSEILEELTDLKPVTIRQALLRLKARNEVSINSAGQYRKLDDVTS
jgi:hypothetical protein